VSRLAGDEFAIIWPGVKEEELARQMARRALAMLKQPVELPDGTKTRHLGDGASIGLALNSGRHRINAEDLLSSADIAMYEAKLHGRGQVCEFTDELRDAVGTRLRLRADLREAIADPVRWGLHVRYQPIIEVRTRRLLGAESLARWEHPELGNISPVVFIPIAEDAGLIAPLGRFVMDQAAQALADWNQRSSGLHVAVNISALHLSEGTLRQDVERVLDRAGIEASGLWLELTESTVMSDPDGSRALLAEMRSIGVGLSIDDFGTGYSSLAYLHDIQATALKVDQSFIHRLMSDDRHRAEQIVRVMVDLAHSLDLVVIAEGIENMRQLEFLDQLGCDAAQGFLIGKPMSQSDLAMRLEPKVAQRAR
jgi:diguanylate cyclase